MSDLDLIYLLFLKMLKFGLMPVILIFLFCSVSCSRIFLAKFTEGASISDMLISWNSKGYLCEMNESFAGFVIIIYSFLLF